MLLAFFYAIRRVCTVFLIRLKVHCDAEVAIKLLGLIHPLKDT